MQRVLFAALLLFASLPAFAQAPGHFYVIKSTINGHVLTAEGDAAATNGRHPAAVAMRPATGAKNQLWYVEAAPGWQGANGLVYIRNYVGGRVLDVEGAQTNVITYPRNPTVDANQLWLPSGGRINGLDQNSQWKCLDVLYANWQYGPKVGMWSCHGQANQQWEWVRQQPTIAIGDVSGRVTVANAGALKFARPLTPWEADQYGIPGTRSYTSNYDKPWVFHERDVGLDLCGRLVVQGLANWRLPTKSEFSQLLAAWKPSASATGGASLERLGWMNAQHWTSHERAGTSNVFHQQLWPNDLSWEIWVGRGDRVQQALVTCVR